MACKCGHEDKDHSCGKGAGCERCECYVTPEQQRDRYRNALEEIRAHIANPCDCFDALDRHCADVIDEIAERALTSPKEPPGS